MKHEGFTPGPWQFSDGVDGRITLWASGKYVANVSGDIKPPDMILISDAPSLNKHNAALLAENERLREELAAMTEKADFHVGRADRLMVTNGNLAEALLKIEYETEKIMRMRGWTEPDSGAEWFGPSCHFIQDTAKAALASREEYGRLYDAAAAFLKKIDNITSEEFERGDDKAEREALRRLSGKSLDKP